MSSLLRKLLEGSFQDPYLDYHWDSSPAQSKYPGKTNDNLVVAWRLDGHQAVSQNHDVPWNDAIGHVFVQCYAGMDIKPGFMFVVSSFIEKEWRKQGLGRQLYLEASRIAKEHGYKGICSDAPGRSREANKMWSRIDHKQSGDWSLLESSSKMTFIGPCDRLCSNFGVAPVKQMVRDATKISQKTFERGVSLRDSFLDRGESLESWVAEKFTDDPNGSGFYKSTFRGKPCMFVQTQGFEFVFSI